MKRKYAVLFLFSIMLLTGCANIASMRASVQLKSAKKYLLSEDYEKAIVRLNKAIKIEPKNVESYILLAEVYQKKDMQDKVEDTLDKAREIENLSDRDIAKIDALDYKRVYSDILNDFYKTGIIGNDDFFLWDAKVNDYKTIDDSNKRFYFVISDVTGDGQNEIIIISRYNSSYQDLSKYDVHVYKIIDRKAIEIFSYDNLSYYDYSVSFLDKDKIALYSNSNIEDADIYRYNPHLIYFSYSDISKDEKEEAVDKLKHNQAKISSDYVVNPLNPSNVKEAIDNPAIVEVPNIEDIDDFYNDELDNKNKRNNDEDYKDLYRDRLMDLIKDKSESFYFKLADVVGDEKDELIIKSDNPEGTEDYFDGNPYYYTVYGVVDNKLYMVTSGYYTFRFLQDGTLMEFEEDDEPHAFFSSKPFKSNSDKDVLRFAYYRQGKYRAGDQEFLEQLLKKPVKIKDSDINIKVTRSNIDKELD